MSNPLMRYPVNGFFPLNAPPARRVVGAAAVNIVKGDVLHDNGAGFATNATTAFNVLTCLGVAAANADNSAGAAGAIDVEYYPIDELTQYAVPVAANAVIAQTNIGTIVDLENNDDIDISDTVAAGLGFFIDEFDASAAAVAANTYGYAIGHFAKFGAQA